MGKHDVMMAGIGGGAGARRCALCVWLGCVGLILSACGGARIQSPSGATPTAGERARLVARFEARQETQGFSPAIAGCLAHGADSLPVSTLRAGTPSNDWYVHVLTSSRCGPPAVREFIVAELRAQFSARSRAFPAAYRSCLIAGIRALAAERISALLVGAIEGRPTINTELNRIAGRCQSAGAR